MQKPYVREGLLLSLRSSERGLKFGIDELNVVEPESLRSSERGLK